MRVCAPTGDGQDLIASRDKSLAVWCEADLPDHPTPLHPKCRNGLLCDQVPEDNPPIASAAGQPSAIRGEGDFPKAINTGAEARQLA
jgi:hypothetical protein